VPGVGCCCFKCKKSIKAHDITFPDLLFAILHDKLSRSLLIEKFSNFVSPSKTIEYFVANHVPWHSKNDKHTIERAGRALGAMLGAVQVTPSSCVASCCGLVPPNATELDALNASIESIKKRVSPEVVQAATRYAKELESGRTIMHGVGKFFFFFSRRCQ
jgi:hypothetical protein